MQGILFLTDTGQVVIIEKDWDDVEFTVKNLETGQVHTTEDLCTLVFQEYEKGDTIFESQVRRYYKQIQN